MLMSLLLAASCATQQPQPAPAPVAPPPAPAPAPPPRTSRAQPSKTVRASYQGEQAAGRPTASGEPYDPDELTAASKIYPIGSTVLVTNPANGRSVKVRINDRGPHVRGRSLDLSKRAAEELGITDQGVARLKVTAHRLQTSEERIHEIHFGFSVRLDAVVIPGHYGSTLVRRTLDPVPPTAQMARHCWLCRQFTALMRR